MAERQEFTGRSYLQAAEDRVLEMAVEVYDISREEAQARKQQRKQLFPQSTAYAKALLERWTGSEQDVNDATHLVRMRLGECLR